MTNINETNRKPDAQFGDTTHDSVNTGQESVTSPVVRSKLVGVGGSYQDFPINGYADIGAAINDAINTAETTGDGHGYLELPPGDFAFSTTIDPGDVQEVHIKGQGGRFNPGTRLEYIGSSEAIDGRQADPDNSRIVNLSDVRLDGPGSTGTYGIRSRQGVRVFRSTIAGFDQGIRTEPVSSGGSSANYTIVQNSMVRECLGAGIRSAGNASWVAHSRLSGNKNGFDSVGGVGVTIHHCAMEGNDNFGVRFSTDERGSNTVAVQSSYFESNGGGGIEFTGGIGTARAQGNFIRGLGTGGVGIRCYFVNRGYIVNNTVEEYGTGIEVEGSGDTWVTANRDVGQTVDPVVSGADRVMTNGVGQNDGDPSTTGQWNGEGFEGATVVDTTNGNIYVYRGGSWVQS